MKKLLMVLVCLFAFASLVACKDDKTETPSEPAVTEAEYKLGMGVVVSLESSKEGLAQVDATVATVVTDKDGKIVVCRIDVAQNKATIADGVVTVSEDLRTKMEKGSDYGMAGKVDNNNDGVMLEWDAQAKAFEAHVVGMTGTEVAAMETTEAKGHQITTDADLLAAGCSMQITGITAVVAKAVNHAR